jgi:nucleolar protein 15
MALDAPTADKIHNEVRAVQKQSTPSSNIKAVMYIGHLPNGFFEEQMKAFFSQFGTVNRVRVARNKRTGKSRHYAFVEFEHEAVAQIVARSMNNYLMYKRILVCHVVPPENVHPETFKNAGRTFKPTDPNARERKLHNKPRTAEQQDARVRKLVASEGRKRKKLAALGIDYEFDGYTAAADKRRARRAAGEAPAPSARAEGKAAVKGATKTIKKSRK